jgi:hypothetical protein
MVVFNKKKAVKKSSALAVQSNVPVLAIPIERSAIAESIGRISQVFSGRGDIVPAQAAEAYDALKDTEKLVESIVQVAKSKMEELVRAKGRPVEGTKGTIRAPEMGYEIRPTRTGFDAKKVEARFRAKQVDVNKYMDPVVSYIINEGKLLSAAADGVLTKDELESCRYDVSFSVVKSKGGE